MAFSTITTALIVLIKIIPIAEKAAAHLSHQDLRGVWCACWKTQKGGEHYQIGSMNIRQIFSAVSGEFYSADLAWPFKGQFKNGQLGGTYKIDKDNVGHFILRFADQRLNTDRLIGTWEGLVVQPSTLAVKEKTGLSLFAARGKCAGPRCHIRKFKSGEGVCTRSED